MTTVPNVGDAFVARLLQEHQKEADRAKGVRTRLAEFGTWLHTGAAALTVDELHRAVEQLMLAIRQLAEAEGLAVNFKAVADQHQPALPAAESSQPLTPIPDGPAPDRTSPDGPGHSRTPEGRIVATTSTINTDTAPVDVQPKGGAK